MISNPQISQITQIETEALSSYLRNLCNLWTVSLQGEP